MLNSSGTVAATSAGVLPSSTRLAANGRVDAMRASARDARPTRHALRAHLRGSSTFPGSRACRRSRRDIGVARLASSCASGVGASEEAVADAVEAGGSSAASAFAESKSASRASSAVCRAVAWSANSSSGENSEQIRYSPIASSRAPMKSNVAGGKRVAALFSGRQRPPCARFARCEQQVHRPRRQHHAEPVVLPRRESDRLDSDCRD